MRRAGSDMKSVTRACKPGQVIRILVLQFSLFELRSTQQVAAQALHRPDGDCAAVPVVHDDLVYVKIILDKLYPLPHSHNQNDILSYFRPHDCDCILSTSIHCTPGCFFQLPNSSARLSLSCFPRSTSTRYINGNGSAIKAAKKKNAGLISPVASVIAPTTAGPNTLDPLSVMA